MTTKQRAFLSKMLEADPKRTRVFLIEPVMRRIFRRMDLAGWVRPHRRMIMQGKTIRFEIGYRLTVKGVRALAKGGA